MKAPDPDHKDAYKFLECKPREKINVKRSKNEVKK